MRDKIIPHLPVWSKPPNKLISYEDRRFIADSGKCGTETVAIFSTKGDKIEEVTAWIKWDYDTYSWAIRPPFTDRIVPLKVECDNHHRMSVLQKLIADTKDNVHKWI